MVLQNVDKAELKLKQKKDNVAGTSIGTECSMHCKQQVIMPLVWSCDPTISKLQMHMLYVYTIMYVCEVYI